MALTHWLLLTLHIEVDPGCSPPKEEGEVAFLHADTHTRKDESTINNFLKGGAAYRSQTSPVVGGGQGAQDNGVKLLQGGRRDHSSLFTSALGVLLSGRFR